MTALFLIFLLIDALIAYYVFRQAFVVRSNMNRKYKIRFVIIMAIIGGAILLQNTNLPLACLIAGLPAGLMLLFATGMGIAAYRHKGPWR